MPPLAGLDADEDAERADEIEALQLVEALIKSEVSVISGTPQEFTLDFIEAPHLLRKLGLSMEGPASDFEEGEMPGLVPVLGGSSSVQKPSSEVDGALAYGGPDLTEDQKRDRLSEALTTFRASDVPEEGTPGRPSVPIEHMLLHVSSREGAVTLAVPDFLVRKNAMVERVGEKDGADMGLSIIACVGEAVGAGSRDEPGACTASGVSAGAVELSVGAENNRYAQNPGNFGRCLTTVVGNANGDDIVNGDCLFETVGLGFGGLNSALIRRRTARFLWELSGSIDVDSMLCAFPLVGSFGCGLTSQEYMQIISSSGVAGGALELMAISEIFRTIIKIDMGEESVIHLNPRNGGKAVEILLKYTNTPGGKCGHYEKVSSISSRTKTRIDMNWSNVYDLGLAIRGGGHDITNELHWKFDPNVPWRLFLAPPEELQEKKDPCKWVAYVYLLVVLACKRTGIGPSLSDFITAFCDDDGKPNVKALLGWTDLIKNLNARSTDAEEIQKEACYESVLSYFNAERTMRGLEEVKQLTTNQVKKIYTRGQPHLLRKLKLLLGNENSNLSLTDDDFKRLCFNDGLPKFPWEGSHPKINEVGATQTWFDADEGSPHLKRMKPAGVKGHTLPPVNSNEKCSVDICQKKDASNFLYAFVQYFSQSFSGMLITRDVLNISMTCKQEKMFDLNGGICHVEDSVIINSKKVTNGYIWRMINQRKEHLVILNVNGCNQFSSFWSGEDFLVDDNDDWQRGLTLSKLQVMEVVGTSAFSIRFLVERCNCLTRLNISSTQIKSLKGIEVLSQLRVLFMSNLEVVDITPVGELRGLMTLVAENCTGLYNLKPITKLSTLKILNIKGSCRVRNFVKITGHLTLVSLSLGFGAVRYTNFEDVVPVRVLSMLRTLYVEVRTENGISNLSCIENGSCLEELALINFPLVTDIQVLSCLVKLKLLQLNGIGVGNMRPLNGCAQLGEVELTQCLRKVDIYQLDKHQPACQSLNLEGSRIYTVAFLVPYISLIYLNITKTEVRNLNGIDSCKSLRSLVAGKNPIRSITQLKECPKLRDLDLSYCELLTGVRTIGELVYLERVDVSGLQGQISLNVRQLVNLKSLCAIRSEIVVRNLHCCTRLRDLAVVGTKNQNLHLFLVGYPTEDKVWRLSCLTIGAPGLFDVAFIFNCDTYKLLRDLTITKSPLKILDAVLGLRELRNIVLDCTLVEDVDVLRLCPKLETIVVRSSVLLAPKMLHDSPTLLEVDLSGTNVMHIDCPALAASEVIVFKAGVLERTLDEFEGEDGGMRGDTNMTTIARTCESFQGVSSAHLAVCKEPSVP